MIDDHWWCGLISETTLYITNFHWLCWEKRPSFIVIDDSKYFAFWYFINIIWRDSNQIPYNYYFACNSALSAKSKHRIDLGQSDLKNVHAQLHSNIFEIISFKRQKCTLPYNRSIVFCRNPIFWSFLGLCNRYNQYTPENLLKYLDNIFFLPQAFKMD